MESPATAGSSAGLRTLGWRCVFLLMLAFRAAAEEEPSSIFLGIPSAESARSNLRFLTKEPHVAGTTGDRLLADFMVQEFQQAGIPNASLFELAVPLTYPDFEAGPPELVLRQPDEHVLFRAKLSESVLQEDDTSDTLWRNHTFHGYSPSGTLKGATMVYANYGRPQDLDALEEAGVSVNGTIVLVRYGNCFRGLKVQNAQNRGALAVLIYSDPADDGYGQGGVYPAGAWRPEDGIQRGSVQFNSHCAGDPFRADPRYQQQHAGSSPLEDLCGVKSPRDLIPSIPSLPISYGDAEPFLRAMGGPLAKDVGGEDFVGGIANLTYRVGPLRSAVVDLQVRNTPPRLTTIPNAVGIIPGRLPPEKDTPVLLGNHRDAWVYGAADPNSGTAALLEVAKGLGYLYSHAGWRPERTIYLLSWSGEEYGLLGSTGWAELHANEPFIRRALAYLNVDTVVSGDILKAWASPSLTTIWKKVLQEANETLAIIPRFANPPFGDMYDTNTGRLLRDDPGVGILGSGSDYTVFLDHFGIPSLDFRFNAKTAYGQYHSVYDSFAWMDQFGGNLGKPGSSFELISFGAKIWGLLALRLADSAIVPLDHIAQGSALASYSQAIYEQGLGLDLAPIDNAVRSYQEAAAKLQLACSQISETSMLGDPTRIDERHECNEKLMLAEREFLLPEGLPKRPWFKHVLQAPGMFLGYAAEVFPGVQQAIDENDLKTAQTQIGKVGERIEAAAAILSS